MKKLLALLLAAAMAFSMVACGPSGSEETPGGTSNPPSSTESDPGTNQDAEHLGTIMWLSNLTSGLQYETYKAYMEAICEAMGYDLTVVFGDMANDAANNLNAVKNGMTEDVVGLVASQDGGLLAIMEEYPDLYVCGFATDMRSVYGGGENAACLENDHFLGTICDGYGDGTKLGQDNANYVIEQGFERVALIEFPAYAYPTLSEAEAAFRSAIEEYNATAETPVEIVGDTLTLEFQPLSESYFLEEGHDDLDAIIAFCAGILFVYPTMSSAIANGTCSPDTKLVTGGFDNDPDIVANIGDDRTISFVQFSPAEDPAYAMVLLDNAITGNQFPDFENIRVNGAPYTIDSTEDIENVMTKSMAGTGDISLTQLSVEEVLDLAVRFNPDATQEGLIAKLHSEQLSVDALKDR